jgi:GAF domain-containing protein
MLADNHSLGQPKKTILPEEEIISLGKLLRKLRDKDDADALIQETIAYIQGQFDYQLIWLALYDRQNHKLVGKGGILPGLDKSFLRQKVSPNVGGILEKVIIAQAPLGVADLRKEGMMGELQVVATKSNIQGTIFLPISYRKNCLGVLALGSQRWGYLLTGEARERLLIAIDQLGDALYKLQINLKQKLLKDPEESLISLIEVVCEANKLDDKLESVVKAAQSFVAGSRTIVYWFEKRGRYFWCRIINQILHHRDEVYQKPIEQIKIQDLNDFYYDLAVGKLVWIGEGSTSLKSQFTGKLLERLKVRSFLAAPIICDRDLVGFLAVENYQARVWSEGDKAFVQSSAGLISLFAQSESLEIRTQQIEEDGEIINQVARAIYSQQDLKQILQNCGARILERLDSHRILLLQYNAEYNNYQVFYQVSSPELEIRFVKLSFDLLSEIDIELLQSAKQAISIENIDEDLRFVNWRIVLQEIHVHSLLICKCAHGSRPDTILVVSDETYHSWTNIERDFLWIISQYFGTLIKNTQVSLSNQENAKISQISQEYFNVLLESDSSMSEVVALQQIASVLDCPLALLISWNSSSQDLAKITPVVFNDPRFRVDTESPLNIHLDSLIQQVLLQEGCLILHRENLPLETTQWLNLPEDGQVFVMLLNKASSDGINTSIVLLANAGYRIWSQKTLQAAEKLVSQLALWQRKQRISQNLASRTDKLQQLNWYKHSRLAEIYRMSSQVIRQIYDLGIPTNDLTQTRYKLLIRQLDFITKSMKITLNHEQWKLHISGETMLISSLMKRSRERVNSIVNQRQLWIGVHGLREILEEWELRQKSMVNGKPTSISDQSIMSIAGDITKIELVIHELLVSACNRAPHGDHIDIWCRPLDEKFLEISIMDNGTIDPQLLDQLHSNAQRNVSTYSSSLTEPPGLHLIICQKIMRQLGGELQIYKVPEDPRVVSRLVLPLAISNSTG